jgi:hypothetical protein
MQIESPLAIMFETGGKVTCAIHPPSGYTHEHYGLLVCDFIRHVARAFRRDESDVWEWVEREWHHPTTTVTTLQNR